MSNFIEVQILRTDDTEEWHTIPKAETRERLEQLIDSDCFDYVNLRDGRGMFVDDNGYAKLKPVNDKATMLYWSVCKPGTAHMIVGDVVVFNDGDIE